MLHLASASRRRPSHFAGGTSVVPPSFRRARPLLPRVLGAALIAAAGSDARGQTSQLAPVVELKPGAGSFVVSDDLPLSPPPSHPPIDTIPPRAMPARDAREPFLGSSGPGASVSFDLTTRRETRTPTDSGDADRPRSRLPDSGRSPGQAGGGEPRDDREPERFRDMSLISPAQRADWPWRRNAKLVMRDGGDYYVCTGTLVDAEVVLTAAHCIYDADGGGWVDQVWVYPGWDGGPQNELSEHYGVAQSTRLFAVDGWTSRGNHEYDVAEVVLQRAVGSLTGWAGYAWGDNCFESRSRTYGNASYPAGSCGSGLHTGRDMYYWSGQFDSCQDENGDGTEGILRIDNGGTGCLSTLWGGMSGSSAYYTDGGSDYVHAVVSHSGTIGGVDVHGNYTKLTSDWKTLIHDSAVPEARGDSFDLQALNVRVESATVAPGGTIDISHLAANPTNGSANRQFRFRVYLSANANIDTTDTLLGTATYDWNLGAMERVRPRTEDITIPGNTPAGNYYVGVIYDSATDGNSDNNDTDGWDAGRVRVGGTTSSDADLVVESAAVSDASLTPGQSFTFSATVRNQGDEASPGATLTYRSRRAGGSWAAVGTDAVRALSPSGSSAESIRLTAPPQAGAYDYGACVSEVTGESETGNNCSDPVRVGVCAVDRLGSAAAKRVVGSWVSGCESTNRPGSYARYYSFVLSRAAEVAITLSSSRDTYLFLLAGAGTDGRVVASNADVSVADRNSRIVRRLSARTYTVEATTFTAATTGSFTLRVSERKPFADDPVVAGLSIKADHITELRGRINELRVSAGLSRYAWADRTIRPGVTPVRAVHWRQLRTALDEVYDEDGRRRPTYADEMEVGVPIQAGHVNELRRAVEGL